MFEFGSNFFCIIFGCNLLSFSFGDNIRIGGNLVFAIGVCGWINELLGAGFFLTYSSYFVLLVFSLWWSYSSFCDYELF